MLDSERELKQIDKQLKESKPFDLSNEMEVVRAFAVRRLASLMELIERANANAKYELAKNVESIWMVPTKTAEGERFYFAVGSWDLLGGGLWPLLEKLKAAINLLISVETSTFGCEYPPPEKAENGVNSPHHGESTSLAKVPAFSMSEPEKLNAHRAWLNVSVRMVGGTAHHCTRILFSAAYSHRIEKVNTWIRIKSETERPSICL